MMNLLLFLTIFTAGEFLFNLTWYRYLKQWFNFQDLSADSENTNEKKQKKFLFLKLSTFKGILERFILAIGLIPGYTPIMVVFGTIKL